MSEPGSAGGASVVVTGATGFVGSRLVEHLQDSGFRVRALVRTAASFPGVEVVAYEGLDDVEGLSIAFKGADAVVHLAARVHVVNDVASDPLAAFRRVNVEGTRNVLNACSEAGVSQFVFVSSIKAVGEDSGSEIWNEETPEEPCDPYGISKLEAEKLVLEFAGARGIDAVILRIPLVYGPGMKANMLRLFMAVRRGLPLPFGCIRNQRSILYLENLVAGIEAVLRARAVRTGTYFLSDREPLSSAQMVRAIAEGYRRSARIIPVPLTVLRALGQLGDAVSGIAPFPVTSSHVQRLTSSLEVTPNRFVEAFDFRHPWTSREGLRRTAGRLQR